MNFKRSYNKKNKFGSILISSTNFNVYLLLSKLFCNQIYLMIDCSNEEKNLFIEQNNLDIELEYDENKIIKINRTVMESIDEIILKSKLVNFTFFEFYDDYNKQVFMNSADDRNLIKTALYIIDLNKFENETHILFSHVEYEDFCKICNDIKSIFGL